VPTVPAPTERMWGPVASSAEHYGTVRASEWRISFASEFATRRATPSQVSLVTRVSTKGVPERLAPQACQGNAFDEKSLSKDESQQDREGKDKGGSHKVVEGGEVEALVLLQP